MVRYAVYLPAIETSDDGTIRALAGLTGLSLADARTILASPLPRRVGATETAEEAEDLARSLRGAGFDAFVVSVEALSRTRTQRVRAARFTPDGVEFEPSGGFGPGALRVIVYGQYVLTREIAISFAADELGPAELGRRTDQWGDSERFAHLYGESSEHALELRPTSFDFHCLGKDWGNASVVNLRRFLERLQLLFPTARYDDTLLRYSPPMEQLEGQMEWLLSSASYVGMTRWGNAAAVLRASRLIAMSIQRR